MHATAITLAYLISGVALLLLGFIVFRVNRQRLEFRSPFTYALFISALTISCATMFIAAATHNIWPNFHIQASSDVFAILTVTTVIWLAMLSRKLTILPRQEDLRAEEEARRTVEAIIDATPIAIIKLDTQGRVMLWNNAAEQMFGWTQEEALGQFLPIVPPEDQEEFQRRFARNMEGSAFAETEIERITKDGRRVATCLWTAPVLDGEGQATAVIGAIADLSEHKKAAKELQLAKALAEKANSAKSVFLANFSHELRTPLAAILGYIELLSNSAISVEKRDHYISYIRNNGLLLGNLVEDILDLSCIEEKKVRIERSSVTVASLLTDLEAVLALRASAKGLEFSIKVEPPIPENIYTDPVRLRQILLNVAGNAIKFTAHGFVHVEVSYDNEKRQLVFAVVDSGPGIPEDKRESIFEPFVQVDQTSRTQNGGAGLGLALARELARALGGNLLLLSSRRGKGSTFEVRIDAEDPRALVANSSQIDHAGAAALSPATTNANATLGGARVLLVEDSDDLRALFGEILSSAGAIVGEAVDGLDAIEQVSQADWDIILMDVQMPRMDGYEAAGALRANGYQRPIIALTASALPEHQQRAVAAGFSCHIAKPIKIAAMLDIIAAYCNRESLNSRVEIGMLPYQIPDLSTSFAEIEAPSK